MADQLYLPPAEDGNGNRLPAAIAYFYLTGTTTPVTVYQSDGVTAIGTSVTADANGVFQQVFTTSGSAIKINVTTALGAAVPGYPQDPAIRVAGTNGQAGQVSFAPTIAIPDTNVQDAIETVQGLVTAEATAREQGRGFTFSTIQTLSGATALDFTSIPTWATEVIVFFNAMTWNAGDNTVVQVGTTDTATVTTGYESASLTGVTGSTTLVTSTTGFVVATGVAADTHTGCMRLYKYAPTVWIADHNVIRTATAACQGAGKVVITGTLNKIRITRSGSASGDGGSANIGWR